LISNIQKTTKIIFLPGALYSRYGFSELEPILTQSDIVILNSREVLELTGRKFQVGAKWLVKKGCKIVVITLGRQGCFIYYSKKSRIIPTVKLSDNKIVDSTGAGDAFATGLVYGLLNKLQLTKAAFLGNLNARFCIQGLGARFGLPDENLLINEFRKYSKVVENE
jgi:sugar/nucleoside kinase (ribokinase family)